MTIEAAEQWQVQHTRECISAYYADGGQSGCVCGAEAVLDELLDKARAQGAREALFDVARAFLADEAGFRDWMARRLEAIGDFKVVL